MTLRIFTIGYEGATMAEFLAALRSAGVERVIDVRALPLSRRPGFSKSPLRGALEEAGIDAVITSDWPLDRFRRGDIALRVPPGRWSDADEFLSNLSIDDE